jgi:hypothetical protein
MVSLGRVTNAVRADAGRLEVLYVGGCGRGRGGCCAAMTLRIVTVLRG